MVFRQVLHFIYFMVVDDCSHATFKESVSDQETTLAHAEKGLDISCAIVGSNNNVEQTHIVHNPPTVTTTPPPVTSLPPREKTLPNFAGRQNFLQDLHKAIDNTASGGDAMSRTTVMTGLGGIGKSSAARKYAKLYQEYHGGNFAWINGRDYESLVESFLTLARHFEILPEITTTNRKGPLGKTEVDILVKKVYEHFSKHVQKGLFIFDSVHELRTGNEPPEILQFLPNETLDHCPLFLMTSRLTDWCTDVGQKIQLGIWEPEGSYSFLVKAFKLHKDCPEYLKSSLKKLGHILGGYPLALNIAAANILNSANLKFSNHQNPTERLKPIFNEIERYITNFETKGTKWIAKGYPKNSADPYHHIIDTVWTESILAIEKQKGGPLAIRLLYHMAVLPYEFITIELLHCIQDNVPIDHDHDGCCQKEVPLDGYRRVREAVHLLDSWSMIQILPKSTLNLVFKEGRKIWIHRVVKKWARVKCVLDKKLEPLQQMQQYLKSNADFLPEWLVKGVDDHIEQMKNESAKLPKRESSCPSPVLSCNESIDQMTQKNCYDFGDAGEGATMNMYHGSKLTRLRKRLSTTRDEMIEPEQKIILELELEAAKKKLEVDRRLAKAERDFIDEELRIRKMMITEEMNKSSRIQEDKKETFCCKKCQHFHNDLSSLNNWDPDLTFLMLVCTFVLHILDWLVSP